MRLIDADKLTIDCYAQGQDGTVLNRFKGCFCGAKMDEVEE